MMSFHKIFNGSLTISRMLKSTINNLKNIFKKQVFNCSSKEGGKISRVDSLHKSRVSDGIIFSVIMPLYNKHNYLQDSINSVLSQTIDNWELIIVDDGSTDESFSLACEFAKKESRIIVLTHKDGCHMGVSASRNLAIKTAKGNYISFLDADDTWMPERLQHDYEIFQKTPEISAIVSKTLWWWPDGSELPRVVKPFDGLSRTLQPQELFRKAFVLGICEPPCVCSVSIKHDVVLEMEPWDSTYAIAEDVKYFANLYLRHSIYVSDLCDAKYRRLAEGAWSSGVKSGADEECHKRLKVWIRNQISQLTDPTETSFVKIDRKFDQKK